MAEHVGKSIFPLVYLKDIVILPHTVIPLLVERQESIMAVEAAYEESCDFVICLQKEHSATNPGLKDLMRTGILASILEFVRLPDGSIKVFIEGKLRVYIKDLVHESGLVHAVVVTTEEMVVNEARAEALRRLVIEAFREYADLKAGDIEKNAIHEISSEEDPGRLADVVATYLNLKIGEQQDLLEENVPEERLEKIYEYIAREIEILKLEVQIKEKISERVGSSRKTLLGGRSKAMHSDTLDRSAFQDDISGLEEKLRAKDMPEAAREKALEELKKLRMMPPMSAEATVVRNYVDWFITLPWSTMSPEEYDISEAEKILNEDHYGLDKVKERILEHLAVKHLVGQLKGPILCFVGPPGVGKTSLGQSIARATGRRFVRVSLGGVRDEAEIKGHRRTYIGALPGKIIQGIKRAGTSNPVFLLDEVDKMSVDFRGDPSAALLEVLDPEQNHTFNDHYLDIDYDISKVMFITTANNMHAIPDPLKDRMEILRIEGYTGFDKLMIAKHFIIPKQLRLNGLEGREVSFTPKAINTIVHEYTREAGVRNLEREISSICRKIARGIVKGIDDKKVSIGPSRVHSFLGVPKYRRPLREKKDIVGMVNGLAWTEAGGELLVVEATVLPGKGNLLLTGKLGEVMQESAQAAMSYVRSRAKEFGLEQDFYDKIDIHIHIPEGAIPKDGPSAGITMATSIISALTKRSARSVVAMTGELTLSGRVLPIGGLKEKLLAAKESGMEQVLIPVENEKDLKETPKGIVRGLDVRLVEHMDEVVKYALN